MACRQSLAWAFNWLSGLFEHGRWADHVAGWRAEAAQNPAQVLWVRYEDLAAAPEAEVRRIAAFLGLDATDDGLVERCVHHSRFRQMKQQAAGWKFFRKGVVGDAERHFTPALAAAFDAAIAEQLRGVATLVYSAAPTSAL